MTPKMTRELSNPSEFICYDVLPLWNNNQMKQILSSLYLHAAIFKALQVIQMYEN